MAPKSEATSAAIAARTKAARDQARREWIALANAANAGETVDHEVLVDLGRALGVAAAGVELAFEEDCEALELHPRALAEAAEADAQVAEMLAPFNGDDLSLADAIRGAQARLDELRSIEAGVHWTRIGAGEARGRARHLAIRHPRVLGEGVR